MLALGLFTIAPVSAYAAVTGVTVSPSNVTVVKGGSQAFTATVTVTAGESQDVTWSVTSTSSSIDSFGNLTVDANEPAASLTVTATSDADGTVFGTATVTVATPQSDATLKSLTVSAGTLSPAFNANTTSYTASVANSVTSVTVTAAPNDPGASVTGNGAHNLNVGDNTITVTVTAADGTTKKVYTITVTRAADSSYTASNRDRGKSGYKPYSTDYISSGTTPSGATLTLQDAISRKQSYVTYQMSPGTGYMELGPDTVSLLLSNGEIGLNIQALNKTAAIAFTSQTLKNMELSQTSTMKIAITQVNIAVKDIVPGTAHDFNIYVDGKRVTSFDPPIKLFFKLNGISEEDNPYLKGVYIDGDGNVKFIGKNIWKSNDFAFESTHCSVYAVMVDKNLVRLNMAEGKNSYTLNGAARTMDAKPAVINGVKMLPLRFVSEAFGGKVTWNGRTRTVSVDLDGKRYDVTEGVKSKGMDVAPFLVGDRMMVPVKYVTDVLGANVVWGEKTGAIAISR